MGHNLSAQHAPEDGTLSPLFPYSYAYKDLVRGFRTVMAYACVTGSCPKIPNFSNPSVLHNGAPTGTATRNNALSINNAAATVANFRQGGSAAPPPTTVAAPTNLSSSVAGLSVTLRWGAVAGADGYNLLVGSGPGLSNVFNGAVGDTTSVSGNVGAGDVLVAGLCVGGRPFQRRLGGIAVHRRYRTARRPGPRRTFSSRSSGGR